MNLLEYTHFELSGLYEKLLPYAGKDLYVHFSNIKKVGINPQKSHGDIHGIYFYPIDWILQSDRAWRGSQYGVTMPYYFIAKIDLDTYGLDLSMVTQSYFNEIMLKYDMYNKIDLADFKAINGMGLPGSKLYNALEHDNKSMYNFYKQFNWVKDTQGIIYPEEPEQVCVRTSSIVEIIDHGTIKDRYHSSAYKQNGFRLLNIIKDHFEDSNLYWSNKSPILEAKYFGMKVKFSLNDNGTTLEYIIDNSNNKYMFSIDLIDVKKNLNDVQKPLIPDIADAVWTDFNHEFMHIRKNKINTALYCSFDYIDRLVNKVFIKPINLSFTVDNDNSSADAKHEFMINDHISGVITVKIKTFGFSITLSMDYKYSTISVCDLKKFNKNDIIDSFEEHTGLSGETFIGLLSNVLNVESSATESEKQHLMLELERTM